VKKWVWFILVAILTILTGCVGSGVGSGGASGLRISGEDVAAVGGFLDLRAHGGNKYTFSASGGSFIHQDKDRAVWQAPMSPGNYIIRVESGGKTVTKTVTVVDAPARITAWSLVNDGIGGKDARITIRNTSARAITAVRIQIAMWNNFGERVTYFGEYLFRGEAPDTYIAPGAEKTFLWSLYWASGVTNIAPWVVEVAFEDGTAWKLYN